MIRPIRIVALFVIVCNGLSPSLLFPNYHVISRRDALITTAISASSVAYQDSNYDDRNPNQESSFRHHKLSDIDRILCLSDIHTDHPKNFAWIQEHCNVLNSRDLLILAGDISHQPSTFRSSLKILRERCQVVFVPGNHEAWLDKQNDESTTIKSSFAKLESIYDICREENVLVDPVYIEGSSNVWILPLESWYDGSLSFDESLCQGFEHWPWVDFARCVWPGFPPSEGPQTARIPSGLVEYFLERNQQYILDPWKQHLEDHPQTSDATVMTISHFAPNIQCLPDWKDLSATQFQTEEWLDHGAGSMSAKFAKVAGTALLDQQLRTYVKTEHLHIFGHSHRPKDFYFESIRYIHNPLGKPRERELHMVPPDVTFQILWEQGKVVPGPTIVRYWEQYGGGVDMLRQRLERVRPGRYNKR